MDDSKSWTTERSLDTGGLAGAVHSRILRLHPQTESGGMVNRLSRQGAGWDRAGVFADEILGRFRSPADVAPSSMPLAKTWGAAPRTETSALRQSASVMPASRQYQIGPETLPTAAPLLSKKGSTDLSYSRSMTGEGTFVQRKAALGVNTAAYDGLRKTADDPSIPSVTDFGRSYKKNDKTASSDIVHNVLPEQTATSPTTATVRMIARLQNTLGPSLVQRHVDFAGAATADVRRSAVSGGTPPKTPIRSGGGVLPMLSGQRKEFGPGQPSSASISLKSAPVLRKVAEQGANAFVAESDRSIKKTVQPKAFAGAAPVKVDPGSMEPTRKVHPLADTAPAPSPPVRPVRPAGAEVIQRHNSGLRPLAGELFARSRPALENKSGNRMPIAASVAGAPDSATESTGSLSGATGMASGSTRSFADFSGSAPLTLPSISAKRVARPSTEAKDAAAAPGSTFLVSPGLGGSVPLMKKSAAALAAPGRSQGEAMPVFPSAVSTLGYQGSPGRSRGLSESLSVPAPPADRVDPAQLPLVQLRGGTREHSTASAGGSDARTGYASVPGMEVQRSSEVDIRSDMSSSSSPSSSGAASAPFSPGRPDTRAAETSSGAAVDMDRLADEVYQIIEQRLIIEKENRGL